MAQEQGAFKGPESTDLFYQCWLPEADTRAAIIVVHGVAEHSGRYMNLVNNMVPQGFAVYGLDHYGHGRSGGKRLFVPRFSVYTDGLDMMVDKVREWESGKKVFIVGHSMGGLITSAYLLDNQDKVDGVILSGPGVKIPDHVSSVTILAAKFFSWLIPALGIKQLDSNDISRDPSVVKAYISDPLVSNGKLTARLAAQMLSACDRVMNEADKITLPLLILHGGADALVDPEGARQFHGAVGSKDKSLTIYPDKFHEIFNDPGYDRVFSDISRWLDARSGDRTGPP